MADVQILAAGSEATPYAYTVPNSQEIVPKAVSAVFDGTGAAGAFLPLLEIVSDAGIVVAQSPASSVQSGGTAEVSWFPRVGTGGGAAASTGLPYLFVSRVPGPSIASGVGFVNIDLNPSQVSVTWGSSDTSIMTLADAGGGIFGPSFVAQGLYVVYVAVELEVGVNPSTPAAAAESRLTGAVNYLFGTPNEAPFVANASLTGNYFANTSPSSVYNVGSPPESVLLQAAQGSGASATSNVVLIAYQLSPTPNPNF